MNTRLHTVVMMIAAMTLLVSGSSSLATTLLHRNVDELATMADRIFVGVCIAVEEKQFGPLHYSEYTFAVLDGIKGVESGVTVVFRQLAAASPSGGIVGLPSYQANTKYMLFLQGDSQLGLTSPIGLGQGAFVLTSKDGSDRALNWFGNRGLFHRMDSGSAQYQMLDAKEKDLMATKAGAVNAPRFVSMVRKLAASP